MKQKLIQIGSSGGVTIPKSVLEEFGAKIGDIVETETDFVKKTFTVKFGNSGPSPSPIEETVAFATTYIEKYRNDFEALAGRFETAAERLERNSKKE